jgi:hypothetical protein
MSEVIGIGAAPRRKEDLRFVTGRGNYVADIERPGMVFGVFVRSPHAHARTEFSFHLADSCGEQLCARKRRHPLRGTRCVNCDLINAAEPMQRGRGKTRDNPKIGRRGTILLCAYPLERTFVNVGDGGNHFRRFEFINFTE